MKGNEDFSEMKINWIVAIISVFMFGYCAAQADVIKYAKSYHSMGQFSGISDFMGLVMTSLLGGVSVLIFVSNSVLAILGKKNIVSRWVMQGKGDMAFLLIIFVASISVACYIGVIVSAYKLGW